MNKTTLIVIILSLLIGYFAFDKFLSEDSSLNSTLNTEPTKFTVIKPPNISTVNDDSQFNGQYDEASTDNNQTTNIGEPRSKRLTYREELIDMQKNKKATYESLGDVLEKINMQKSTSKTVKENVTRIKHNLVLSKKIAALTKKLHIDKDGDKELDKNVLAEILEIQKQLKIPSMIVNYDSEDINVK